MDDQEANRAESDNAKEAADGHLPEGAAATPSLMGILLVPVLALACAVIIGYLSVFSSKTLDLTRNISQLQYESEQLRLHVIAHDQEPRQVDMADAFRRRLHELKSAGSWGPYSQQIKSVMLQGGQFAEQAEQARFTHTMLERVAEHLSGRLKQSSGSIEIQNIYQQLLAYLLPVLHPIAPYSEQELLSWRNEIQSVLRQQSASLDEVEQQQLQDTMMSLEPALLRFVQYRSVTEAVTGSHFPEQLRQLKLSLFQYQQHLNRLTMLFSVVLALTGFGSVGYGWVSCRRKRAQSFIMRKAYKQSEGRGASGAESGPENGSKAKKDRADVPVGPTSGKEVIAVEPVLDTQLMLDNMDGDREAVAMLLRVFIDEHALDAKKLQQLVHQRQPDAIDETAYRLIHSLKGVAGGIGAEALRQQAERIDFCYKHQQVVADEEYRILSQVLDETIVAARRFLTEQPVRVR